MAIPLEYFDNGEIRKYVVVFGELFSGLRLRRETKTGTNGQFQRVPIAYGGREKYVARNEQDPDTMKATAIALPRMAYEMVGITPDPTRQLNPILRQVYETADGVASRFVPTPYNFMFNLYITARNVEDASKIVQQIVPYFANAYNIKAEIIDNTCASDLLISLLNVDMDDNYQGPLTERRQLIWTLSFVLKGWFFGLETQQGGVIRWVRNNYPTENDANSYVYVSNTYPTVEGKTIDEILPSDVYIVQTDLTDFIG